MSKAMGALFLKDKVSRLESHVGQLEFKRDSAYSRGKGRGRGMAMGMGNSTGGRGRGGSVKVTTGLQPSDLEVSRDENPSEFHERVSEEEEKRRGKEKERDLSNLPNIRILDSSVLIYSLRTVHEWLKKDQNVLIIPLEGEFFPPCLLFVSFLSFLSFGRNSKRNCTINTHLPVFPNPTLWNF